MNITQKNFVVIIFRSCYNQLVMKSFIDNILKNKRKKKKFTVSTENMGVNIDKNEFYEIKLSNSNHPEDMK